MRGVIVWLLCSLLFINALSFATAESTIAEQPRFLSKVVLKVKQILRLDDDLIRKIVEANTLDNEDSAKINIQAETTRKLFRICERLTSIDKEEASGGPCIEREVNIDYDALPIYENFGGIIAFDKPNNFLSYLQRDNYKYTEFDHNTFFFCDENKAYAYDGDYPNIILELDVSEHQDICLTNILSKAKIISDLKEFKELNPRVRKKLTLDGREVIEIYWKHGKETGFIYFDANDYKYIKSVERRKEEPYDRLVEGEGLVSFMEFKQNVYAKSVDLDVSDVEFALWDGKREDVPNFRDMMRCPVDVKPIPFPRPSNPDYKATPIQYGNVMVYNPADAKIIEQLDKLGKELSQLERNEFKDVSEEQWNEYESLRVSLPQARCSGEKPISYKLYNELLKGTGYSFSSSSLDYRMKQINRDKIDEAELLQT
ncbi:hypothetical protein HY450_01655 [Candidatus Pacearchaeota archaeon]|nr:hypothetical protein [Candidatus Pacearchaeota archaeon]